MTVKIVAFGIARDIMGGFESLIEINPGSRISDVKEIIVQTHPEFAKLASLRVAMNESYVKDEEIVHENDEIILIPPVSGG